MTRRLVLIGIGAGDPDWITVQAIRAIEQLDVCFVVVKEDDYDDLVAARREVLARYRDPLPPVVELPDPPRPWRTTPDYADAVARWRRQRLAAWSAAVAEHLPAGGTGGFLMWGDPGLYESTLAIADEIAGGADLRDDPIELEVIPGVSSALAIAARHRIPLNRQGRAVQIMPARLLRDGMPPCLDDAVVMLDGQQTFARIDPAGLDIYWGAYLGTPDEILIRGDLAAVRDEIVAARAAAAERKGWVFDTYLIRRR